MGTQQQPAWPAWDQVAAGRKIEGAHVVPWDSDPRLREQRAVDRVLIRVDCIPQKADIGGYLCERGANYLLVYEDEVEGIRGQVATDAQKRRLEDAKASYAIALRQHAKARHGLEDAKTAGEQELAMAEAEKTFGGSPWTFYSRTVNGISGNEDTAVSFVDPGFPPLMSLEVCEERVKPPLNPHSYAVDRDERLGAAVAKGVAAALAQLGFKPGKS